MAAPRPFQPHEFSYFCAMYVTAKEISQLVSGTIIGNPDVQVNRPSKIEEATEGSITFLANPKYESFAYQTKASIILVSSDFKPTQDIHPTQIYVDDVYKALQVLLSNFDQPNGALKGISSLAQINSEAKVHDSSAVGAFSKISKGAQIGMNTMIHDQVFIGENVVIGDNVKIFPGVRIMHGCIVGDRCVIHPNAVIGSEGFGFLKNEDGSYKKIPQIGNVVLEDDVEIGANTVIDRATMGSTLLRRGVKLDNLIQIAHNVEIDEHTALAAQAGVAGSTKIGKGVIIGGQAGVVGHVKIADGTMIQAQSGVAGSVKDENSKLYGSPAISYGQYLKAYAAFKQLPDMIKKLRALEEEIERLKSDGADSE